MFDCVIIALFIIIVLPMLFVIFALTFYPVYLFFEWLLSTVEDERLKISKNERKGIRYMGNTY